MGSRRRGVSLDILVILVAWPSGAGKMFLGLLSELRVTENLGQTFG